MLKTCGKQSCQPTEQIRGAMGPGDYFDVIVNNRIPVPGAIPEPEKYGVPIRTAQDVGDHDPAHCVEMDDANRDDFRICCKTCGRATPWNKSDAPGMPGVGQDWSRKLWNERVLD